MTTTSDSVGSYRVLVVDNQAEVRAKIKRVIRDLGLPQDICVIEAATTAETLCALREYYVDLVVLDVFLLPGVPSAFEIVNEMALQGCCSNVIMMTHVDTSRHFDDIMRIVTRIENPCVVNFFRTEELGQNLPESLRRLVSEYSRSVIEVSGLGYAAGLVHERRSRYPADRNALRTEGAQLEVEIERLCRRLFGASAGTSRETSVAVRLESLKRHGLSAAVLVRAVVQTRLDVPSGGANTFECVLKLGPVDDIRTEVARYEEFVRYGVHLVQRVELLGWAGDQAIGAIAYSFAGGVHGDSLYTLDELLRQDSPLADDLIDGLFTTVSWYAVEAGNREIRPHVEAGNPRRLSTSIDRNMRSLEKIDHKLAEVSFAYGREGQQSVLRISDAPALALPGMEFIDSGWCYAEFPQCMVHGDLHGGNVMTELDADERIARVCLIDYRSAGPGPRCIDAVALESSVRIADAKQIAEGVGADGSDAVPPDRLVEAMRIAARRSSAERQHYEATLELRERPVIDARWARLSMVIVSGTRNSFATGNPVAADEYLQTALLYVVRQLGYPMDPLVRVRLCAWLSALYGIAGKRFLKVDP